MKILMLSSFYPPFLGGISVYVQSLCRELSRRGHQVVVGTLGRRDLPESEDDSGIKVIRQEGFFQKIPFLFKDPARKWHPPARDPVISNKLANIIEQEGPDIIHTHSWILYSMLPLRNKFNVPLVHTIHDYGLFCPKRMAIKEDAICNRPSLMNCISCMNRPYGLLRVVSAYYGIRANRNKLKYVDKFIAVSDFVRQIHEKCLAISSQKIITLPDFSDPFIDNRQEQIEALPDDFLLYVGWLMSHKGVDVLIEAYRKLNTPVKLLIIGIEHPDYRYHTEGNILVLKNVPRRLLMQAMSRCRFAIFPSIWPEPFGLVVTEAMSQGKAVIATNTGGFTDIIMDGETGILVPPNDSGKLAEAISYLLRRPEEVLRMGRGGYDRFMKNYTPDVVIPKVIDVYESLLRGKERA
jgi:glycosyltransferase involved in cell wall biosynthesis